MFPELIAESTGCTYCTPLATLSRVWCVDSYYPKYVLIFLSFLLWNITLAYGVGQFFFTLVGLFLASIPNCFQYGLHDLWDLPQQLCIGLYAFRDKLNLFLIGGRKDEFVLCLTLMLMSLDIGDASSPEDCIVRLLVGFNCKYFLHIFQSLLGFSSLYL